MANLALVGQVQVELNSQFSITSYDFSAKGDRPVSVKFGAQGAIGSSKGQEKPTGSFKFAVPSTGLEFDWVSLMANPLGFTLAFPIGAERHQVYGVQVNSRDFTNNPENGETVWSIGWTATEWIRIS